jgi:hypothetical protein
LVTEWSISIRRKERKMISKSMMSLALVAAFVSAPAVAQQVIYPAKGQSAQQQQKDEAECYAWAKGQTGYDPAQATQTAAPPPQQPVGGERARGAMRGAAAGAVIGEVANDDAGKGARTGAAVGVVAGGARQRQKQAANQQAAAQQQQSSTQQQQDFQRAYGACFEGRGYTVK